MYKILITSAFMIGALFLIRVLMALMISDKTKVPFKEQLDFDVIELVLLIIFFIFPASSILWLVETDLISANWIYLALTIPLILLINFNYIIHPFSYLLKNTQYARMGEYEAMLLEKHKIHFNIRLIPGKVTNAYVTGVLPFSRVILVGEELLKIMTRAQVEGIIMHEVGHFKHGHLRKLFYISLLVSPLVISLFIVRNEIEILNDFLILDLASVGLAGAMLGFLLLYIPGKFQKKYELQADLFAAKAVGMETYFSALDIMDEISNGEVSKGGMTHPNLASRVKHIKSMMHEEA